MSPITHRKQHADGGKTAEAAHTRRNPHLRKKGQIDPHICPKLRKTARHTANRRKKGQMEARGCPKLRKEDSAYKAQTLLCVKRDRWRSVDVPNYAIEAGHPSGHPLRSFLRKKRQIAPLYVPNYAKEELCKGEEGKEGGRIAWGSKRVTRRRHPFHGCIGYRKPNQAFHTSLPAALAAATSALSSSSLASTSPLMKASTS
ncbi:hypothetical protein PG2022B_0334 [Bifidobacterium animalis subsp. animalis]|nr:hypothetical protein PG2022B_0334 [Bifidobacterium animalis subsp. animalis]